jgi:hypothetical protein
MRKLAVSIVILVTAIILFLIGALLIYSSKDDGLFFEPQSAINTENANLIQKSHPDLKELIHSFVNESLAERARLQAIKKLWLGLGKILLILSTIQIGCLALFLFLNRSNEVRRTS